MKTIARIYTDFPEKFGVPRQSGLVPGLMGKIIFEKEYAIPDAVRGLERFSHVWLIWRFSETEREKWLPTVRPPRLGGNKRMGVFATRSPFRPNAIGLSSVRLIEIEYSTKLGPILYIEGADMISGTPILDVKPYLPSADCHPEALGGFADMNVTAKLVVDFPHALLQDVPDEKRDALFGVLAQDPRPRYQNDPERVYGMIFGNMEIKFLVKESVLTVIGVFPL